MTELQIVSDLHIEYKNDEIPDPLSLIKPKADILILAGDIGSLYKIEQLKGFLTRLCVYFKNVLYIPGNHEFYMVPNDKYLPLSMTQLTYRLYLLEKEIPNLYILNQSSVIINNICIAGCTLWSKPEINIPKFIVRINGMTTSLYEQKYQSDLRYINKMIKYCKVNNLKLVVATHHCPTYDVLKNSYKENDRFVSLYVSKLDYLLTANNIDTWIAGHTHKNFDFVTKDGTRIVSNQKGKPRDNVTDFQLDYIVKIENVIQIINKQEIIISSFGYENYETIKV